MAIVLRIFRGLLFSPRTVRFLSGPIGHYVVHRLQRWPLVGLGASLLLAIATRSPLAIALAAGRIVSLARNFRRFR